MSKPLETLDKVIVNKEAQVTNLGLGVVLDIICDSKTGFPAQALVRFENGPAKGVWYSVGNLTLVGQIGPSDPSLDKFGSGC